MCPTTQLQLHAISTQHKQDTWEHFFAQQFGRHQWSHSPWCSHYRRFTYSGFTVTLYGQWMFCKFIQSFHSISTLNGLCCRPTLGLYWFRSTLSTTKAMHWLSTVLTKTLTALRYFEWSTKQFANKPRQAIRKPLFLGMNNNYLSRKCNYFELIV